MRKLFAFLLCLTCLVLLWAGVARAYTAPPPPVRGGYVLDQTGRMSPSDIQQLNQKIDRISKATNNEFACVLLQSLEGDTIEDAAGTIFHTWGIGKHGLDNGLLIIVSLKDRKSRIETGKGVEGEVTDLQANDILKKNLNPQLKAGNFAAGFSNTVDALGSLLESRAQAKLTPPPAPTTTQDTTPMPAGTPASEGSKSSGNGGLILLLVLGVGGFIVVAMWLSARSRQREMLEEEERVSRLREQVRRQNAADAAAAAARRAATQVSTPASEVRRSRPAPTVHHHAHAVTSTPSRPLTPSYTPPSPIEGAAAVATAAAVYELSRRRRDEEDAAEERRSRVRREEEERVEARRREEEDRAAERRQRDEEDRRRRDDDTSSSSSSDSSFDWSGSSGGGNDGGGFGGGDSGGGGSSSDW